jgi:hypothetical protein
MTKPKSIVVGGLLLLSIATARANIIFALHNGGNVSGSPGGTVEWTGTVSETNPGEYAVVTNSQFCEGPVGSPCVSLSGFYTDEIATNFSNFSYVVIQAPLFAGDIVSYIGGIGTFTLDPSVPPGTSITGQIVLDYDLYSDSPNDPSFDPVDNPGEAISYGNELSVSASINVPEPSSWLLLATAGVVFLIRRKAVMETDCSK